MLVDLDGLLDQARRLGGELSFRKLLRAIAGTARVARAVCFVTDDTSATVRRSLQAAGFELAVHPDADAARDALGATLEGLDWSVDTLVLAPMSRPWAATASALTDRGIAVETAGLDDKGASGQPDRLLGRGCLFVP